FYPLSSSNHWSRGSVGWTSIDRSTVRIVRRPVGRTAPSNRARSLARPATLHRHGRVPVDAQASGRLLLGAATRRETCKYTHRFFEGPMPKAHTKYVCQQCGYESAKYLGRCPDCGEWNTMVETVIPAARPGGQDRAATLARGGQAVAIPLPQV